MLKHAVARAQQENAARAGAAAEEIKRLRAQLSQQAAHIRTLRAEQASFDGGQVQTSSSGCSMNGSLRCTSDNRLQRKRHEQSSDLTPADLGRLVRARLALVQMVRHGSSQLQVRLAKAVLEWCLPPGMMRLAWCSPGSWI